jgi:deazaflavin-dependent oxidoreductase (nitroreductase family)
VSGAGIKDASFRVVTALHKVVFQATKGRVAGRGLGMPVLMLTTTGRKSGKPRTTMLTTPLREENKVVLVASYGGDPRHPAWFMNLRDNPEVELTMEGSKRRMRARVAAGEERADLWARLTEKHRNYAAYQKRTDRELPVVVLEPVA